ncbi:unnamed protein product [Sphenostylis stenocarpa]|uniref:SKP1-like protein 21 n=1 Tax=Sphenostylis stenocarpa TaxID=92480 RepID=A0AA86VYL0_9FABA|nr:unnamed protein product [Sphenostylis stenocarpa]
MEEVVARLNITWFIAIAPPALSFSTGLVETVLMRMLLDLSLESRAISFCEEYLKCLYLSCKPKALKNTYNLCLFSMSEVAMAVVKPEMKSYIWLQTVDGSIQQVEEEVAMFCPMICQEVLQTGMGSSKTYAISLPHRVNPAILGLILDYCRFHQVPGHSNKINEYLSVLRLKERKTFDEKFIRMDTKKLCELTSAADSLQLKPLVDLTSRALARIIEGKTPEEIRETFHLPDDLTEEEKLEPLRNITDDPRIRLLNRLYARKRKELKERKKLKDVEIEEEPKDERSLEDLLSFINGADGDMKGTRANKNKKKNRRRKDQAKDLSSKNANENNKVRLLPQHIRLGLNLLPSAFHNVNFDNSLEASASKPSRMQTFPTVNFSPKFEFIDGDVDDDLDPAMKEELDREVEDFARRLNSDWPERMQILSLSQDRRLGLLVVLRYDSGLRAKQAVMPIIERVIYGYRLLIRDSEAVADNSTSKVSGS